jgi:hypothetical protein
MRIEFNETREAEDAMTYLVSNDGFACLFYGTC